MLTLIEQSGGIVTSQRLDRWTQRLERWRGRAFATPQFVLVVDGLNERARTDWAPWLSSLASYAATIGGRVVATSRAKYFRRLDDRFSVPRRTITLDNLSDVELDRALVVHGIQPGQIARRVRRSLRKPTMLLPLSSRHCLFLSNDPAHANFCPQFTTCDVEMVAGINRMTRKNAWQYLYSCSSSFSE